MAISSTSPNVDNYYMGKGKVEWKPTGGSYIDLGNAAQVEFTPAIDRLDHFSQRAGVKNKDRSVIRQKSATVRVILEEWTALNLTLALMGTAAGAPPAETTITIYAVSEIKGSLKFTGQNDVGPQWTFEYPNVDFTPSSKLDLIGDDWGQIELTGEVLADNDGHFGTAKATFPA